MRYAIVDDEEDARILIKTLVSSICPDFFCLWEAEGVQTAKLQFIDKIPDLLFLDVNMKDGTGFHLLDLFRESMCDVIFVTAYDEFAVKAFQYSASDYLLKPIDVDLLSDAIKKVKHRTISKNTEAINNLNSIYQSQKFEKILLTLENEVLLVTILDIIRLAADGSYTKVFLKNGEKYLVSKNLKEFEDIFPENSFFRIHNSHIINLNCVKKITKLEGTFVILENGDKIEVSRRRKQDFYDVLLKSNMRLE